MKRSNRHSAATRIVTSGNHFFADLLASSPRPNHEPNTQQPLNTPIAWANGAYVFPLFSQAPTVETRREHQRATYLQMLVDGFTCNEAESIAYWNNLPAR